MDKTFAFTLDDKIPVNPSNAFEFWRGDNVVFNFTFKNGSDDLTIPPNTTLRIFAKKIGPNGLVNKDDAPLFAGDFTTPTTASFNSSQTAGDAGNYLLAVMLMASDSSIITAQGIYFNLLENGYAGIYQPSEDFRDEVLDALEKALAAAAAASSSAEQSADRATFSDNRANAAAQSAKVAQQSAHAAVVADSETARMLAMAEKAQSNAAASATASAQSATDAQAAQAAAELAKNQAQEIVDPDNRIGQLFQTKLDSGTLYCNGGAAEATPDISGDTISVLLKTNYKFPTPSAALEFTPFCLGETRLGKFFSVRFGTSSVGVTVYIEATRLASFSQAAVALQINKNSELNALAFVFKKLADGNAQVSLFANGTAITASYTSTIAFPTLESFVRLFRWGSNVNVPAVGYSDFRIFNFDVSASDAPYTLADYQAGKRLPPNLTGVQLALENYTIMRNTTTQLIKDASGNGHDATVLSGGTVAGDMDKSIAVLVDELKTQINQQA